MFRVLVADDEPAVRQLLETNLRLEGYETYSAADGATALDIIKNYAPDVVLLDIMMPNMDGLEVLSHLVDAKIDARVILVSACAQGSDRVLGWELGCDEYITKPFDLEDLLARVADVAVRTQGAKVARRAAALAELTTGPRLNARPLEHPVVN